MQTTRRTLNTCLSIAAIPLWFVFLCFVFTFVMWLEVVVYDGEPSYFSLLKSLFSTVKNESELWMPMGIFFVYAFCVVALSLCAMRFTRWGESFHYVPLSGAAAFLTVVLGGLLFLWGCPGVNFLMAGVLWLFFSPAWAVATGCHYLMCRYYARLNSQAHPCKSDYVFTYPKRARGKAERPKEGIPLAKNPHAD